MRKRLFVTLLCACMCFGTGCSGTDSNKTNVETTVNETTTIAATTTIVETTVQETTTVEETTEEETTTNSFNHSADDFPTKERVDEIKGEYDYKSIARNPQKYNQYWYKIKLEIFQKCKYNFEDGLKVDWYYKALDEDGNILYVADFRNYSEPDGYDGILEGDNITAYAWIIGNSDISYEDSDTIGEGLVVGLIHCDIE